MARGSQAESLVGLGNRRPSECDASCPYVFNGAGQGKIRWFHHSLSERLRASVMLRSTVSAIVLTLCASVLAAQAPVEIQGRVAGVSGVEVSLRVDGDLLPRAGDQVQILTEVPGVGKQPLAGAWSVTTVTQTEVIAEPADAEGVPRVGNTARIISPHPQSRADVPRTLSTEDRGAGILARVIEALGGADRLDALQTLRWVQTIDEPAESGTQSYKRTFLAAYPDQFRLDIHRPSNEESISIGKTEGFRQLKRETVPIEEEQLPSARRPFQLSVFTLLRLRRELGIRVSFAGERDDSGRRQLDVTVGPDELKLFVDSAHRVTGRELTLKQPDGSTKRLTSLFSDFREVGGLILPFQVRFEVDGELSFEVGTESVTLNQPIDPSEFEPDQQQKSQIAWSILTGKSGVYRNFVKAGRLFRELCQEGHRRSCERAGFYEAFLDAGRRTAPRERVKVGDFQDFIGLSRGQKKGRVLKRFGEPSKRRPTTRDGEIWTYNRGDTGLDWLTVVFDDKDRIQRIMLDEQHSVDQLARRGVKEPKLMIGHLRTHVREMLDAPEDGDRYWDGWRHHETKTRVRLTLNFPNGTFGLCNGMSVTWSYR